MIQASTDHSLGALAVARRPGDTLSGAASSLLKGGWCVYSFGANLLPNPGEPQEGAASEVTEKRFRTMARFRGSESVFFRIGLWRRSC